MGDSQLFLLRVWQHQGRFRASVRGVAQEELMLFTEPGQLTEFLVRTTTAAPSEAPPGPCGPTPSGASR